MKLEVYCDFTLMAAHHLPLLPESHQCHRLHGHNYKIRLYVTGPLGPKGWIIDYAEIADLWKEVVHDIADHRCLNDVDGLDNPTCENLAMWIYKRMKIPGCEVSRIEVQEEPNSGVVFTL